MLLVGAIFYFFIASILKILIKIGIAFSDSGPFWFLQILVHRFLILNRLIIMLILASRPLI